jgi:hypothetical protein
VQLDFGSAALPGSDRFLEIGVRRNNAEPYTVLSPRSKITSSPYAIRSLNATNAENAVNAQNAAAAQNSQKLGGISANQYLLVNGDGSQLTNINATVGDGSVTTPKIADGSVTAAKLAPGTIAAATSQYDPQLLGMLRWDLLPTGRTIPVGNTPLALAFDGTFIYVANASSNSVTRIRASSGLVEGNRRRSKPASLIEWQ